MTALKYEKPRVRKVHRHTTSLRHELCAATIIAIGASTMSAAHAAPFTLATGGGSCPVFHCDPEGGGLMHHGVPVPTSAHMATASNLLLSSASNPVIVQADGTTPYTVPGIPDGTNNIPGFQSCSSDGTHSVCLLQAPYAGVEPYNSISALAFSVNPTSSTGLPVIDNFTLANPTVVGGGTWQEGRLNVNGNTGAVALIGQDSVIVADGNGVKRINFDGTQQWPTSSADPRGSVFNSPTGLGINSSRKVVGLTPIQYGTDTAVAVAFKQTEGTATKGYIVVFNLTDGSFITTYAMPTDGTTYYLAPSTPPVAHGADLYVVGYTFDRKSPGLAQLLKLTLGSGSSGFTVTQSNLWTGSSAVGATGASPLYYDPTQYGGTGSASVILHVPNSTALNCASGGGASDRLVYFDAGTIACTTAATLNGPLQVGPAVDPNRRGVWVWTADTANLTGTKLYFYDGAGNPGASIDLATICNAAGSGVCGSSANPAFVGHMFTVQLPGDPSKVYVLSEIAGLLGVGNTKSVVAVDTSGSGSLYWAAPLTDTTTVSFGGAIPVVSVPGGKSGVVFAGGTLPVTASNAKGNVSLVYGQ